MVLVSTSGSNFIKRVTVVIIQTLCTNKINSLNLRSHEPKNK